MACSANQGEVETHVDTHHDSQNGTDVDTTLLSGEEGYTERVSDILVDIEEGLFYNSIQVSRRTVKNKQLDNEIFNDSVYSQNQSGFTTSRPLFWLASINTYIVNSPDVDAKTFIKYPKSSAEKCQYIKTLINFDVSRRVEVLINSLSGVVLVKGNHYKLWIKQELPKLLQLNGLDIDMTRNDVEHDDNTNEDKTAKKKQKLMSQKR